MPSVWDTPVDFGIDYKIDTSNLNTDFNTPLPSFDWSRAADISFYDAPAIDRTYSFPADSFANSSEKRQEQKQPTWMKALESALGYKTYGSSSSSSRGRQRRPRGSSAGGGEVAAQGRGYTVYQPAPTQKTETRSRQPSGIGSTLGTLAGIGVSMIPGVGPVAEFAQKAAPTIGRTLGGFFD